MTDIAASTLAPLVTAYSPAPALPPRAVPPPAGRRYSLFSEALLSLSVLATIALLIAIVNVLVFEDVIGKRNGTVLVSLLLLADVSVFVLFGAFKLQSLVLRPLADVMAATEAIAAGDLTRRAPVGTTVELARLADSVNYMTSRLLEEQSRHAHLEKMASVSQLAAGVAHEIGGPLAAISAHVQTLRAREGMGADSAPYDAGPGIEREVARIDRIVRGMLDYAQPRRAAFTLIDANESVAGAVAIVRARGALRDVALALSVQPGTPRISGDRYELEQAVVNLIVNAVSAMGGTGELRIVSQCAAFESVMGGNQRRSDDPASYAVAREPNARLRAWLGRVGRPPQVLKVVIADSGPGVLWSDSERIFEPFYTTGEASEGAGLGLAIVARTVEGMGGTVWVRPAREGGAAFVLLFPVPDDSVIETRLGDE